MKNINRNKIVTTTLFIIKFILVVLFMIFVIKFL